VKSKFGLSENTIDKINRVLSHYPEVNKAILYGSRAKGNYRNGSDIDLTLLGGDDMNLSILARILSEIDDLLLPYSFDISIYADISDPDFLDHIERVGEIFYTRDDFVSLSRASNEV
jgi:uncharacterized protein